jgi:hypothetical protein
MLPGLGSFMELLGSQSRFVGWAKLGRHVFVEFAEAPLGGDWNPDQTLFAPKALCHIHVAVPAPCPGFFSSYAAPSFVEVAAAICTFALGRAVTLPPAVFAAPQDKVADLDAKRADTSIGTLTRKRVPLDVFGFLDYPGGQDTFERARSALLTFDAAKQTKHDSVACVLFVVTAECLTSVHTSWQTEKVTRRFWEFFEQLMPADLDAIVNHQNFLEVFDIKRGVRTDQQMRKKLLEKIYSFRSGNVHSGLKPIYRGFASGVDGGGVARRSFFADFAEAAILRFIESPRSSVVGHPNIDLEAANSV